MAAKHGLITGSLQFEPAELDEFAEHEIETDHGEVTYLEGNKFILINRHGKSKTVPPHKINHHANISVFAVLKIKKVIGISSVGSLNPELKPPMFILPDDYINLWDIPTFFDNEIKHITPGLNDELGETLYEKMKELNLLVVKGGTYIQTHGPRLETKAEINMLKDYGDVIGMTMASEATLAKEKELKFAIISSIDNYCHGITPESLSFEIIKENQQKSSENILNILQALVKH
jgi:5'-methylthioadenosine phosphorylase